MLNYVVLCWSVELCSNPQGYFILYLPSPDSPPLLYTTLGAGGDGVSFFLLLYHTMWSCFLFLFAFASFPAYEESCWVFVILIIYHRSNSDGS
jgi:hypothetical protein